MHTLRLYADPSAPEPQQREAVARAAAILRAGGTVAFATETVYGLGANALDPEAIAKIFTAKQRPAWDPLIVHIADQSMLTLVTASIPPAAQVLMERLWPGPLTLLVPRHPQLPRAVTAGRELVGVRMPSHPVARALIRAAGVPIAAPSANTFGHVSPTTAAHVAADLDGRIDAILDSGETTHGLESTVVDTSVAPCILYRPGSVTIEELRAVWPSIEPYLPAPDPAHSQTPEALPSPGLDLRHYAPRARLVLVQAAEGQTLVTALLSALEQARMNHRRVGLMLPLSIGLEAAAAMTAGATAVYDWGTWLDPATLAHRLFAGLRKLDQEGVEIIVCPEPPAQGLGAAIADRLRKAARRD